MCIKFADFSSCKRFLLEISGYVGFIANEHIAQIASKISNRHLIQTHSFLDSPSDNRISVFIIPKNREILKGATESIHSVLL